MDNIRLRKRKKSIIFLNKIVLLIISTGLCFPLPVFVAQARTAQSYVIKLKSAGLDKALSDVGFNVQPRFTFSSESQFANVFTFNSSFPFAELQKDLKGTYEFLEINHPLQQQAITVNDPGFTANPQDIDKQWALVKLGFPDAWSKTTGSKDNIVAIIDTGVDATHEDLRTINFVPGFNFLTREGIVGFTNSDDNGHGTLVGGILGATPNNNIGIAGTNWLISIMPLKALDSSGRGDVATVSEAIVWAAAHGANFINLSIGGIGFGHDVILASAIASAFNKNTLIVAAAGNDMAATGGNLDLEPVYPICDDNNMNMVIGVAAVDQNDLKPEFSNYGKNCIDIVAPGKRILSTINHDPITKTISPNSYAYASGTSLAVPFVVGQAALLKTLYPFATNIQLRDKIITTAEQIDYLNTNQCSGSSCRGLLGAGRINVKNSTEGPLMIQSSLEGELVKSENSNVVYQISGGQKRPVSLFVMNQRFQGLPVKTIPSSILASLPEGPYVTPYEGTLIRLVSNPTVYMISKGQKLPVSYQIFKQRQFNFSNVKAVDIVGFDSWVTGNFLAPLEGSLVRGVKNRTVYWVVGQVLHPINYTFYIEKGLNIFQVLIIPDRDLTGFAKGEAYIR